MAESGVSMPEVAQCLGHTDPSITFRDIGGGGRTIGDMLAIVNKRIASSTAAARSIRDATIAEQQNSRPGVRVIGRVLARAKAKKRPSRKMAA